MNTNAYTIVNEMGETLYSNAGDPLALPPSPVVAPQTPLAIPPTTKIKIVNPRTVNSRTVTTAAPLRPAVAKGIQVPKCTVITGQVVAPQYSNVQTTYVPPMTTTSNVYTLEKMESQLVIINNNVKTVFDFVKAVLDRMDNLEAQMKSVKDYIDIEKDMIPVLISKKDVQNVAEALDEHSSVFPINLTPCSIPLRRLSVDSSGTPVPPLPGISVRKNLTASPKRKGPKSKRPNNYVPEPAVTIPQNGGDVDYKDAAYSVIEETVEYMDEDLGVITEQDPLMDIPENIIMDQDTFVLTFDENEMLSNPLDDDSPIDSPVVETPPVMVQRQMQIKPQQVQVKVAEEQGEDFNPWTNFHVKDVADFEAKNNLLQFDPKLRNQLKTIFDKGHKNRIEHFMKWFADDFLDGMVWSSLSKLANGKQFSGTEIAKLLEESWTSKNPEFAFADFVRLQLYNAKSRVSKRRAESKGLTSFTPKPSILRGPKVVLQGTTKIAKPLTDAEKKWKSILESRKNRK